MITPSRQLGAVLRPLLAVAWLVLSTACSLLAPPASRELPLAERTPLEPLERHEFVLYSDRQQVVGEPQIMLTRYEDTFPAIARAYGLGYDELVAANPDVDPWLPGEGQAVLLPSQYILPQGAREGVVLNVAAKRLFFFPPAVEGEPARVLTYPIGIGRVGWDTPLGDTKVVAKTTDPAWRVPVSVRREHAANGDPLPAVVPPGPDNPLGRHALRLQMPSYLIHGTNKPYGVGMRVSHGCVRLYPENIEHLYGLVEVGEAVAIVNQPYLLAWRGGELYLEAHAPLEDDAVGPARRLQTLLVEVEAQAGYVPDQDAEVLLLHTVVAASGVPVRVFQEGFEQVPRRARLVRNILPADEPDDLEVPIEPEDLEEAEADDTYGLLRW